jgi:hypothetical protein
VRIVCTLLLFGSIQLAKANGIIGAPLISREITDTFSGYLFAYDASFTDNTTIANWSFFAGSANGGNVVGHQITPVIMDRTDPNDWVITGVGTTETVLTAGVNSFSFGLISGANFLGPNLTFGWYDGSATSQNQGTISFDRATTTIGVRDFSVAQFPLLGMSYQTKNDFTGANDGTSWSGGRIYSFQFDLEEVPEPSTFALIAGGLAIVACLRRRRSLQGASRSDSSV